MEGRDPMHNRAIVIPLVIAMLLSSLASTFCSSGARHGRGSALLPTRHRPSLRSLLLQIPRQATESLPPYSGVVDSYDELALPASCAIPLAGWSSTYVGLI